MSNSNIWEMYGLYSNPFTSEPLAMFSKDIPLDMFVGREKELATVNKIISSHSSSRILVCGNIGIGKTTFVNYIRYSWFNKGFFTPFAEIGVQSHWTAEDLMIETLSAIYYTIKRIDGLKEKLTKVNKNLMENLESIFGIYRGSDIGFSLNSSIVGGGFSRGKSISPPHINSYMLIDTMKHVVENLKQVGYKKLIIQYNNLELIPEMGDKELKKLFNGIREFIESPDTHFIFIGDNTVHQFFNQIPRVEQVFQSPVFLEPFRIDEIRLIMEKRIEILSIKGEGIKIKPLNPVFPDAIKVLYDLYNGNVRDIMKGIATVITEIVTNKPIQINELILKRVLFKLAKEKFLSALNRTDLKVLNVIIMKGETTNKLISGKLKMQPQNVSNSITTLRERKAVRLSRVEGRARYYTTSAEAKWLLLQPNPIEQGQRSLSEMM